MTREPAEEVIALLARVNAARRAGTGDPGPEAEAAARFDPAVRVAVYGTLAPGGSNHRLLADLPGSWLGGTVRGFRDGSGWGRTGGYPGMRPDPAGQPVPVQVFESAALREHWVRLDDFEGEAYVRLLVPVVTAAGIVVANLYAVTGSTGRGP